MAKVPFSKLKLKTNDSIKELNYNDEITIEVKQYLPIQEKLELISKVVMLAHEEDANFSNPVKASIFTDLEIIFAYTNISFTDKQKEDLPKLYDMLKSSGILDTIIREVIPAEETGAIYLGVADSIKAIYDYQNSVLGILDTISTDYSDLKFDIEELKNNIANPNNLELIKNTLTKLG